MINLKYAALGLCSALILGTPHASASAWIEQNLGQVPEAYQFIVRSDGLTGYIAADRVDLQLPAPARQNPRSAQLAATGEPDLNGLTEQAMIETVRLHLLNANPLAVAEHVAAKTGRSHYLRGSEAANWVANVPHLSQVIYRDIYPGIDVVYRLRDTRLEYDFELAAGADPDLIRLRLEGAESLHLEPSGDLVAATAGGTLRQRAPEVFRLTPDGRKLLDGQFVQSDDHSVGFKLANYDDAERVIIDPIIEFSGYVGGSQADAASVLLEAADGDLVLLGRTHSPDLVGVPPGMATGEQDVFVTRIDASSGDIEWVTYVGGSRDDFADSMVIDSAGNIVVSGYTESLDYPTVNAFQSTYVGSQEYPGDFLEYDTTLFKLTPDGSALIFSTYFGGEDTNTDDALGFEFARGLIVDSSDAIFMTGQTGAPDFPVTKTFLDRACMESDVNHQRLFVSDIFIAKFAPDGSLLESICIGGTERDSGRDIRLGANGDIYVGGFGRSDDLPIPTGGYQPLPLFPLADTPFVLKIDSDLTEILFGTYVGVGFMQKIALDANGAIYGAGQTNVEDFPVTAGAFQTELGDGIDTNDIRYTDAFVFKLAPDGQTLEYSTLLGGTRGETSVSVTVDAQGRAYVAGETDSADFPVQAPLSATLGTVLGGLETTTQVSQAQALHQELGPDTVDIQTVMYVARNGVNQWYAESPEFDALPQDISSDTLDTRDIIRVFTSFDDTARIVTVNADGPNRSYDWDAGLEAFVPGPDYGAADRDSRAASLIGTLRFSPGKLFIANYGDANELYLPNSQTPLLLGRADGRTTAVIVGSLGESLSISSVIFGNEGQDVRYLPHINGGIYDTPIVLSDAGTAVTSLVTGDLNGDGSVDLVIGNADAPNQIVLFDGNTPTAPVDLNGPIDHTLSLGLLDFDQDGDLDILTGNLGDDALYINNDGVFVRDAAFIGNSGPTPALSVGRGNCSGCDTAYLATEQDIKRVRSARSAVFLSVLDPTGSVLQSSSIIDGGGSESFFRGIELAGPGRVLLGATTDGNAWPQVGSDQNYVGRNDAVVMVVNLDEDGDGVLDGADNCIEVANPDQRDSNQDGFGNVCDADLNNDGVINVVDLGRLRSVFFTADEDADFNGDGVVNVVDLGVLRETFFGAPGPSGL